MTSITIAAATGIITITFNAANVGALAAGQNLIRLNPYIASTPSGGGAAVFNELAASYALGVTGALDWACSSVTNATATARGMDTNIVAGTMLAKYVPSECR